VLVVAWRLDNHVVDVYFDTLSHQMAENFVHQPLVGCSSVFKTKGHNSVKVLGVIHDEGGLVHVRCGHRDLVVSKICIQETKYFIPCRVINKSVDIG